VPGSAQDSAGSGGVRNGSTTHSDYLTSTGSFEPSAESPPTRIGHITFDVKHAGKPSAGNLHAGFDEAGAGDQRTMRLVRHPRGNGEHQIAAFTAPWRQSSTLLMLLGVELPPELSDDCIFT
jgi:hypothetical protein